MGIVSGPDCLGGGGPETNVSMGIYICSVNYINVLLVEMSLFNTHYSMGFSSKLVYNKTPPVEEEFPRICWTMDRHIQFDIHSNSTSHVYSSTPHHRL